MSEESINKLLASCWRALSLDQRQVYENLTKNRNYIEDVRGVREHNRNGNNKKVGVMQRDTDPKLEARIYPDQIKHEIPGKQLSAAI